MNNLGKMENLEKQVQQFIDQNILTHFGIRIGKGDKVLYENYYSPEGKFDEHSMIEVASCTKIVATSSIAFVAMEKGLISKDDLVSKYFPVPEDKKKLTIQNIMTHSLGYGYNNYCFNEISHENVAEFVLKKPILFAPGTRVMYSCSAMILLGKILEKVFGEPLDVLFKKYVANPLGMESSCFLYEDKGDRYLINVNQSESARTLVNDYNCRYLENRVGNAGLFTNMHDIGLYINMLQKKGAPLYSEEIFNKAIVNYTEGMEESRGLGFLIVDDRYFQTGGFFPNGTVGHCGHTGQCIFLDPVSGVYTIILTNATRTIVKNNIKLVDVEGCRVLQGYDIVMNMRKKTHQAIKKDLEEKNIKIFE